MSNDVFDMPDALSRFTAMKGLCPESGGKVISEYIVLVKVRKFIRSLTDAQIDELNLQLFADRLNKFNKWTHDKLLGRLEIMSNLRLMRVLYVREKESAEDALLCLLGKKYFGQYDQKFLTNWFKYGTKLDR